MQASQTTTERCGSLFVVLVCCLVISVTVVEGIVSEKEAEGVKNDARRTFIVALDMYLKPSALDELLRSITLYKREDGIGIEPVSETSDDADHDLISFCSRTHFEYHIRNCAKYTPHPDDDHLHTPDHDIEIEEERGRLASQCRFMTDYFTVSVAAPRNVKEFASLHDRQDERERLYRCLRDDWLYAPSMQLTSETTTGGKESTKLLFPNIRSISMDATMVGSSPRKIFAHDNFENNEFDNDLDAHTRRSVLKAKQRKFAAGRDAQVETVFELDIPDGVWKKTGTKGGGVKVGLMDTGIARNHPRFRNTHVVECLDFTPQKTCVDGFGHGTFVAGVVAESSNLGRCGGGGIAPEASLYIFKVFTDQQASYTTWFLDALNAAIQLEIDVINLSIGGLDYYDEPFTNKVAELSSVGITLVTAIGNDGPRHGSSYNPADQLDVIGVGAVTKNLLVSSFSSRGMTTWEFPEGIGRVKPDLVTYGDQLIGMSLKGSQCRTLSGSSVASPVVTGVSTLVIAILKSRKEISKECVNVAAVKQILQESSDPLLPQDDDETILDRKSSAYNYPLTDWSMLGHGAGVLNATAAAEYAAGRWIPHISAFPSQLMLSETPCVYFRPFCDQKLYFGSYPVVLNVSVFNSASAYASLISMNVEFSDEDDQSLKQCGDTGSQLLKVDLEPSSTLFPFTGYVGVSLGVRRKFCDATVSSAIVSGTISLVYNGGTELQRREHILEIPFSVKIVQPVGKEKRILWDVFHQIQFPPYRISSDDIEQTADFADWNGDHPYTNFMDCYLYLTQNLGYAVDIHRTDFTQVKDWSVYSAVLIIDAEEYLFSEEIRALKVAVEEKGVSLVIFSDWYNTEVMKRKQFVDDNTDENWVLASGGANVPALNDLLRTWNIQLSERVYYGEISILAPSAALPGEGRGAEVGHSAVSNGKETPIMKSGGSIFSAPDVMWTCPSRYDLEDHSVSQRRKVSNVPIMGVLDIADLFGHSGTQVGDGKIAIVGEPTEKKRSGTVSILTDSNCLDSVHTNNKRKYCFAILGSLLAIASSSERNRVSPVLDGSTCRRKSEIIAKGDTAKGDGRRQVDVNPSAKAAKRPAPVVDDPLSSVSIVLRSEDNIAVARQLPRRESRLRNERRSKLSKFLPTLQNANTGAFRSLEKKKRGRNLHSHMTTHNHPSETAVTTRHGDLSHGHVPEFTTSAYVVATGVSHVEHTDYFLAVQYAVLFLSVSAVSVAFVVYFTVKKPRWVSGILRGRGGHHIGRSVI